MDVAQFALAVNQGPAGARGHLVIDPPGCGCTECITGEYVPLDEAKPWQLERLFTGSAVNNTGLRFEAVANSDAGTVKVVPHWEDGGLVADSVRSGRTEARWRSVADGWEMRLS